MGFVPVPNRTVGTSMKRNKDLYLWFADEYIANIYCGDWIGKKRLRSVRILFKLTVSCFKSPDSTPQYFSDLDFDFTLSTLSYKNSKSLILMINLFII